MKPRVLAVVSFRLGGTDGVSVEAAKWIQAWRTLGYDVMRVAGVIDAAPFPHDTVLPWLSIDAPSDPVDDEVDQAHTDALAQVLEPADVVVVENLCSLPMNLRAARTTAHVLSQRARPVVLHHHDLPWQREQYASIVDLPPDTPDTVHVTINARSRAELIERGYEARRIVHIPNCFDPDVPPGDREQARHALGFRANDVVLLQPTRAIPRKNVAGGLDFAARLQARLPGHRVRYWLTGPPEDGYAPALDTLVGAASVPVTVGRVDDVADAYAAADLVVFPSTWEGFGNPLVEASIARRAVVAGDYPVRAELEALGLWFLSLVDVEGAVAWVRRPDERRLAANVAAVRRHLDLASLPERLAGALGRLQRAGRARTAS